MVDEAAGGGLQLWRVRCVCARSFPPSHARLSSIASLRDSTEPCTAWLRDPISCGGAAESWLPKLARAHEKLEFQGALHALRAAAPSQRGGRGGRAGRAGRV